MPEYARNKHANFEYEILETYEAGIVLSGAETKAIRKYGAKLDDAFAIFSGDKLALINAHIAPYPYAPKNTGYDPKQSRALLLHHKEISYLRGKTAIKGLTIIPLSIYTKGRRIKVSLALVRGKKQYEKKEAKKQKDIDRDIRREMKDWK